HRGVAVMGLPGAASGRRNWKPPLGGGYICPFGGCIPSKGCAVAEDTRRGREGNPDIGEVWYCFPYPDKKCEMPRSRVAPLRSNSDGKRKCCQIPDPLLGRDL